MYQHIRHEINPIWSIQIHQFQIHQFHFLLTLFYFYLPYILAYKSHFLYLYEINTKIKCILYTDQTKREGNIWHILGGNTIILFYNINNEYMNNKQIN